MIDSAIAFIVGGLVGLYILNPLLCALMTAVRAQTDAGRFKGWLFRTPSKRLMIIMYTDQDPK